LILNIKVSDMQRSEPGGKQRNPEAENSDHEISRTQMKTRRLTCGFINYATSKGIAEIQVS
jgi:hypothetical protein